MVINLSVLKDKNALIIFLSQLVSAICDKMMSIGLIWYLTKDYSINVVPWYLAISFLPHVFMAFVSTNIINKMGTLKTVIASEFFRGFVLLGLYFILFCFNLNQTSMLSAIFVAGFLVGIGSSLFNPAILSIPPRVVNADKVAGVNALIDASISISTIMGATLAIFILNWLDIKMLVLINSLSFFWAGLLQLGLKEKILNDQVTENADSISPRFVLTTYPDIARMLVSFLFLNLLFTPLLVMIPWYVINKYAGSSGTLALIEGAMGVGAFITGMFMSLSSYQVGKEKRVSMISAVFLLFGISFLFFAFSNATWQGAFVLFSVGVLSTFLNIQVLTYFQTALKEEEVPAIMTAVNIISAASVPLSLSFSGLIFPYVSIPLFAKASGILIVLTAIIMPKFLRGTLWKSE